LTDAMPAAAARVLAEVDAALPEAVALLTALVATPSVGGTDPEHEIQARLARDLSDGGLEVDHWALPLDDLLARPDFPGVEVDRREAWGLVGRLPGDGTGEKRSLLLNGHVDVVPIGDPAAWSRPDAVRPRRLRHEGRACSLDHCRGGVCRLFSGLLWRHRNLRYCR